MPRSEPQEPDEIAAFRDEMGRLGLLQQIGCLKLLLNTPLRSASDLRHLANRAPHPEAGLFHAIIRGADDAEQHVRLRDGDTAGLSEAEVTAKYEQAQKDVWPGFLAYLEAIAARGRGEALTRDQCKRLNDLRAVMAREMLRSGYRPLKDEDGARYTAWCSTGCDESPVGRCAQLLRTLESRIAEGLAPRLCDWERCVRGRDARDPSDAGRRWFLPRSGGQRRDRYCCPQCADAHLKDLKRRRAKQGASGASG
ncbi:MAG: hypothetical protein FJX75_15535 [Armatimonadetes bacterium]|nr:hypothetical protein [Armatimonadota bacterium]